ncbi:hypothetical protein HK100_002682 [Physocladia obscura]|uniref:NmrA-like domain-containing protein n=1 Tax=Physocladia obscura TaxID=109957 RepID=A0AAD5XJG5_9FUNG|nr:hypothetical protein HK100_002682 [Physocladia obscura]
MTQTFLVTGATGAQGGSAARQLILQGFKVHALVRNPLSKEAKSLHDLGVKIFKGDYMDIAAISEAIAGVSGVFLNTFPAEPERGEIKQAELFVAAAQAAKTVTTFVVSTVFHSSEKLEFVSAKPGYAFLKFYYTQKKGVEQVVKAAGFQYWTILRPDWLYYNYLAPPSKIHFPKYQSDHILTVSHEPSFKQTHFDPADVGKFAAAALAEPDKFHGETIELSHEPLTYTEIAGYLSKASGVEVIVEYRSQEETESLLATIPVLESQLLAKELKFDYDAHALEKYGIELRTLSEFLEREKPRLFETFGL